MESTEMDIDEEFYEGDEDEFEIVGTGNSEEANRFDSIVGRLEEIVVSDEFMHIKDSFMSRYSHEFTSEEENKLVYMEIFQEYLGTIERYLEAQLADVDMQEFCAMLVQHQEEIDGPLFEMMLTFSDFLAFKQMMLESQHEGLLIVSGATSVIHQDEMEDGDERPDLDDIILSCSGLNK